jgi:hypothetical protein
MEAGGDRARAAVTWLVVAVLAVVAVGVVYLHPRLPGPPAVAPSRTPAFVPTVQLASAAFTDADHGDVSVVGNPLGPAVNRVAYRTADGGRTWRRLSGERGVITTIGPADRGTVLEIVDQSGGMNLTLDAGRTWRPLALLTPYAPLLRTTQVPGAWSALVSRHR